MGIMDHLAISSMRRSFALHSTKNSFSEVKDLQLAAEIGKSLLERNEVLESEIKTQEAIIYDQSQEIEHLTKQVGSMKEETLSRNKIYEQLEGNLYELERTNVDLGKKRELDKKRIQSMCENIDYLEKKCEELNCTLETLRDTNKKRRNLNSDYYYSYSGSSESSEDDNSILFKRRSQSLQDLRDYMPPSPEDYNYNDSSRSHSNSPDIKAALDENDFISTLEARIEELIRSRKLETEKLNQLEAQLRVLAEENAQLQKQLSQLQTEKNEEIFELKQKLSNQFSKKFKKLSIIPKKSTADNHSNNPEICKRCSTEINILSLVNSIEFENDDYHSLECELARANEESSSSPNSIETSMPPAAKTPAAVAQPSTTTTVAAKPSADQPYISKELERGFLDYFFGTNSILRKIHKRRSEMSLVEDIGSAPITFGTGVGGMFDEIEQLQDQSMLVEEDSCVLKDIGQENLHKNDNQFQSLDFQSLDYNSVNNRGRGLIFQLDSHRKLAPVEKKVIEQGDYINRVPVRNNFDERCVEDTGTIKSIDVKNRSKLWWIVWIVLMILGTIKLTWQVTRLIVGFFFSLILPRRSPPTTMIKSSSIFSPKELPAQYKKLPVKIS